MCAWKCWPLQLAVQFDSKKDVGGARVEDSFHVTFWGLLLLIVGFLLQALGTVFHGY